MRKDIRKKKMLEQLRITPIVQVACEKAGISRMTYYRWRKDDKEFLNKTDKALSDGSLLINDMAESQLVSAIRDKNIHAIRLWLRHHHPTYANKLEIDAQVKVEEELTPEQEQLIKKALSFASLIPKEITKS
mgnify:CR=1 FL=1